MAKKIKLSIPEPCHENWQQMTPTEKGRFCGACQTQVVDFTRVSDEELFRIFSKPSTGSVCGRFREAQLNHPISSVRNHSFPFVKQAAAIMLPALLLSCSVESQGTPLVEQHMVQSNDTIPSVRGKIVAAPDHVYRISGRVLDEEGLPLPGAIIRVTAAAATVVTNNEGYYSISIPAYPGKTNISVEAIGYKTAVKKIKLRKKNYELKDQHFSMTSEEVVIAGMIIRAPE